MDLLQRRFLFLDGQTSGLSAQRSELIELAWSLSPSHFKGKEFNPPDLAAETTHIESSLLRPKAIEAVPKKVWRMTGINPDELENASDPIEVWKRLVTLPGITALVIHYSQFEIPFLKALHSQSFGEPAELPWPVICTYRFAKRLYPELPARSLRALSGYFGYALPEAHRAKSHVAATQWIWQNLLERLKADVGVQTWEAFQNWWENGVTPLPQTKTKRRYLVEREKRLDLPDEPGVYEMISRDGKLLYVGKATSLNRRVNSYFRQKKKTRSRLKELMTQVADIRVTTTATPLEAALLENDLIKKHHPPYNHSLRKFSRKLIYVSPSLDHFSENREANHPWGPITSPSVFESLERLLLIQRGEEEKIPKPMLKHSPEITRKKLTPLLAHLKKGDQDSLTLRDLFQIARFAPKPKKLENNPLLMSEKSSQESLTTEEAEQLAEASLYRKLHRARKTLHRAHWLLWLTESKVFWEVPKQGFRVLEIQCGEVQKAFFQTKRPHPEEFKRIRVPLRQRQAKMDLTTYDRMRILGTELQALKKKGIPFTVQYSKTRIFDQLYSAFEETSAQ